MSYAKIDEELGRLITAEIKPGGDPGEVGKMCREMVVSMLAGLPEASDDAIIAVMGEAMGQSLMPAFAPNLANGMGRDLARTALSSLRPHLASIAAGADEAGRLLDGTGAELYAATTDRDQTINRAEAAEAQEGSKSTETQIGQAAELLRRHGWDCTPPGPEVKFGCYLDLASMKEPVPDGCVIDDGLHETCFYANKGMSKFDCRYWRIVSDANIRAALAGRG